MNKGYWSVSFTLNNQNPTLREKDYYRLSVSAPDGRAEQIQFEYPAMPDTACRTVVCRIWTADYLFYRGWSKEDILRYELPSKDIYTEDEMAEFIKSMGYVLCVFMKEHLPMTVFGDVDQIEKIEKENIESNTDLGVRLVIAKLTK